MLAVAAVVATFTVAVCGPLPLICNMLGKLQVGAGVTAGLMAQVRFTVPVNDPIGAKTRLKLAVCPVVIVCEVGDPGAGATVKSVAIPETTTACEFVPALSATIRFALAAPAAVGANITLIEQLVSGSTVVQLFV